MCKHNAYCGGCIHYNQDESVCKLDGVTVDAITSYCGEFKSIYYKEVGGG